VASAYLELLRPANVVTAAADIVAGYAVSGATTLDRLPSLVVSSMCLYAGGVVLNDVFDRHIDARERPERPIPSGRIAVARAALLGAALLVTGVLSATSASREAGLIAAALAIAVLVYDAAAKRHPVAGPTAMGTCRGLNFVLGLAAVPAAVSTFWPLSLLAVSYIAGVTVISRGEVAGGRTAMAGVSLALVGGSIAVLAVVAGWQGVRAPVALAFAAALAWLVLPPLLDARRLPDAGAIRLAVKRGVLSLVLLDAALAAAFAGTSYGVAVLATGLVAGYLARFFAVT